MPTPIYSPESRCENVRSPARQVKQSAESVGSGNAGDAALSEIRAIFEPGIWQDFSKEHRTLRKELETSLTAYQAGKFCDPMAVWGAFGAGKTQFLYWVAEHALEKGLIPVYCHLNDLLDRVPDNSTPEGFRDHARAFVSKLVETLRSDSNLLAAIPQPRPVEVKAKDQPPA